MLPELCAAIRYHHRQRVYAMEQRKRADLALGSFLRLMLGWHRDLPKDESDNIKGAVSRLIELGEAIAKNDTRPEAKRKVIVTSDDPTFLEWQNVILASIKARAPFDEIEKAAKKEGAHLATQLPVWADFAEHIHGVGEASLAIIIAEAGDLSNYPKKGHLWKRMGVAVVDGVRQGGLPKSAHKDDWIEHGYNRMRRSRMWTIGDTLIKAHGPYREVYLARKEYERQQAEALGLIVAPSAKIPAKRAAEYMSDGHIHRRAQRYMEKRLLRDLWQAWNGRKANAVLPEMAYPEVPTVHLLAAE